MSNQAPRPARFDRATVYTILVAVAVFAIWLIGPNLLAPLLKEEYSPEAVATATAAAEATAMATEVAAVQAESDAATAVAPAQEAPAPTAAPAAPTEEPTEAPPQAPTPVPAEINGLPTILWDDLPPEAWDTIALIDEGGPFPFERDGITFQNREGLLPDEPRGYYQEYTVITPGESDRGARRIIAGEAGELYYTDDHYASFSYVVR